MSPRESIHLSYSPSYGLLVNSNAGPNTFVQQMIEEWAATGAKELRIKVGNNEFVMVPKKKIKA